MDLVKKGGSLKLHHEINDIIARVTLIIKEIPEFLSLRLNLDLCVYVLNVVVNMVKNKKIDCDEIVIGVMTKVFELNESEVVTLKSQIAYLHSSKAVRKVSNAELFFKYLKKKVLKL
jgi:hypothetical protein